MPSIAFIGPDGAGKTTVARMLENSNLLRFKYLYMGINTSASNFALPTSRLIESRRTGRRRRGASGGVPSAEVPAGARSIRAKKPVGRGWAAARLVHRLAEEWFRQLVSWYFQWRGYAVLYDRHFMFDFSADVTADPSESLDKRLHRWCLMHLYPRPDLVIYLDAPGEVLFARKGESSIEELERRRRAFLRQGEALPRFIRVDATRPLGEVYQEAAQHVVQFCRGSRRWAAEGRRG